MSELNKFTQPDSSADFFVNFLDTLDRHPQVAAFRNDVHKRMGLAAGGKFLDVGCGVGGATIPVAEYTGAAGLTAGVDISSAMLDVALRRANNRPGIEFQLGDACAIPYPDGFFDVARCERVFLYLPDRLAAIREMMRVVKPGGRIYLIDTEVSSPAIYTANPAVAQKMLSIVAASVPNPQSGRELPSLARKAGLRDISAEAFAMTFPHEFLTRALAGSLYKAAENGIVPRAEVDDWLGEQAALHASGDFFQMYFLVLVTGSV
jgi:ubiquinone/menaquinone biosynthesis C-methylase UbiE